MKKKKTLVCLNSGHESPKFCGMMFQNWMFLDQTKITKTSSKLRNPAGYGLKTMAHLDPQEFGC
jgi:hypothetical protein